MEVKNILTGEQPGQKPESMAQRAAKEASWTRDIVSQISEFIHHLRDFCHIYTSSNPLFT